MNALQIFVPSLRSPLYPKPEDRYPTTFTSDAGTEVLHGDQLSINGLVGTRFSLELPENSNSTGLQWSVRMNRTTKMGLKVVEDELIPDAQARVGAGSRHRFTFQIDRKAESPLKFQMVLEQPWGETVPPTAVKDITLKVWSNPRIGPTDVRN